MDSPLQNLSPSASATGHASPVERTGTLGKFGSFWMPKSSQEIAQRAGPQPSRPDAGSQPNQAKRQAAERNLPKSPFREVISEKQRGTANKAGPAPRLSNPPPKGANSSSIAGRPLPSAAHPASVRMPNGNPGSSILKTQVSDRAVADKPFPTVNSRKESPLETLKNLKEQKEKDTQYHEGKEERRGNEEDHGAGNAKRGRKVMNNPLKENSQPSTNVKPVTIEAEDPSLSAKKSAEARSGLPAVATSSGLEADNGGDRFLQSNPDSRGSARLAFVRLRQRIGDFMNGDVRVARMAIDLPSGDRLGIKMRFIGDQLEVIFATDDLALRSALHEGWRELSDRLGEDSNLLPPAFAGRNYEGLIRENWNKAA